MDAQTVLAITIPTLAVLVGILINHSRLGDMNSRLGDVNSRLGDMNSRLGDTNARVDDFRTHFDQRLDDTRDTLRTELLRVEGVLDARLSNVEQRLSHLEERYR